MCRKPGPAYRMPGAAGGGITVFSHKPAGTSGKIGEKHRKPGPADELKRKIRRVFSFSGLPPGFLGASPELREGLPTFPEEPEAFFAVMETLRTVSKALAGGALRRIAASPLLPRRFHPAGRAQLSGVEPSATAV